MTILAYPAISRPVVSSVTDILDDLVFSHTQDLSTLHSLKVFWDLDTSVSRILSLLPEPVRQSISKTNRAVWGAYRLYYIPGKQFSVNKDHNEVDFYDLSQYYPDDVDIPSPLGLQAKADRLWQTLIDLGMDSTKTLASPVAIALSSGVLDRVKPLIPTVYDLPDNWLDVVEFAVRAGGREWVSNYQVGYWENLYHYDRSSAYPAEAVLLPDLRDCELTCFDELDFSRAYGFLEGDLYIEPDSELAHCSPVLTHLPDGQLTNAVGHLSTDVYSLDLIRHVLFKGLGTFKLNHAWYIHPRAGVRPRYPFRDVMNNLFSQRNQSPQASYILKRVMNGLIGKLLESRKDGKGGVRYGDFYNPVYHAIILVNNTCAVSDFIIHNQIGVNELVHVGVDGVKSTRELLLPPVASMGQWRKSGPEKTIVVSPAGIYTENRGKVTPELFGALVDARPGAGRYAFDGWELDLRTLPARQNRRYKTLPGTGAKLLGEKYLSEAVVL